MTEVIDRLAAAVNAHDLDAVAGLIHEDYRSEQPAHPGRAFAGRAQMLANWEAMLAGIPDFCAEICRSVQDGDTTWTEWRWSGTRSDGQTFEMRGVTLFEVTGGQIAGGRLYLEDVERDVVSIEQAVEDLSVARRGPRTSRTAQRPFSQLEIEPTHLHSRDSVHQPPVGGLMAPGDISPAAFLRSLATCPLRRVKRLGSHRPPATVSDQPIARHQRRARAPRASGSRRSPGPRGRARRSRGPLP